MTFTYNRDPPSETNVKFRFNFSCFKDLHVLFVGIYMSGRSMLPILFIHRIFVAIFEGERAQEKGEDEKSERRRVGGERSRVDRRSVLKSLLNLSLPSETAYIYRQYRGGESLAAGRLRNRMVDTNLRLLLV